MPEYFNEIPDDPKLVEWILDQKLFHVATAPLSGGHVNVSPKGLRSFKLVNRKACWYLDLTGSGNETISHIYEPGNGRITILFQAFEGPPRILRLYGKGKVFERGTPEFEKFFDPQGDPGDYDSPTPEILPGARSVIWIDITKVGIACGYSVPVMEFISHRDVLTSQCKLMEERDATIDDPYSKPLPLKYSLKKYHYIMNGWSIDGLPGLKHVNARATSELIKATMVEYNLDPSGLTSSQHHPPLFSPITFALGLSFGVALTLFIQNGPKLLLHWHS